MSYTNFNNYGVQKDGDEYRLVSNTIPVKYFKLGNKPDGVITAGVFTIDEDTNLVTFTSPFIYRINGGEHTPVQTTLQLNAWDDDFVRIDAIYGKTDGTYDFIEGNAGNDYLLPNIPEGTVLIGAIQRGVLFPRQNIVAINSFIGDLPKIGGSVFGDIIVLNGSNFIRRAIAGTSDSGDDIYQDGDGNEIFRTFHYDGKLFVRIANDTAREYEVVTSDSVVSFVINDSGTSLSSAWSSEKTNDELALKVNLTDITEDIPIAFGDPNLSGNNYTNLALANQTVQLSYTNSNGAQLPYITFNSSGVGVLPDVPISGNSQSNITIRGNTGTLANYATNAALGVVKEQINTQTKLGYFCEGSFSWNDTTKVLTWSSNLWIFNRKKLATNPSAVIMAAGSIDFIVTTSSTTNQFWTVYVEVASTFSDGGNVGNISLTTADLKYKGQRDVNIGDVRNVTTLVLFTYNKATGNVYSPFLNEFLDTKYLKDASAVADFTVPFNKYPNIPKQLKNSFSKFTLLANKTAEERFRILTYGDSIFARTVHTGVLNIIPDSNPPTLVTKNIPAYIWESLETNKPLYSRFDKASIFTETGTFATLNVGVAIWDDSGDIDCQTRVSSDTNAAFSFSIAAGVTYFNLIDRSDSIGTLDAIVAVTDGNGLVMAKLDDGVSSWAEANGFVFSQRKIDTGANDGNTMYQRRILFKKVSTGVGTSQNFTISKQTANSSTLMYWGIEEVQNTHGYCQLINVARGSHTATTGLNLSDYILSDVRDRKPDLIIFELPLINMVVATATNTPQTLIDSIQDFVFGDRAGHTNTWNLKSLSSGFTTFDVLIIIPHHTRTQYNVSTVPSLVINSAGYDYGELYRAAKGYLYQRNEVPFIDMSTTFRDTILSDPLWANNFYFGYGSDPSTLKDGNTYVVDGTHPNNKGADVYATDLIPLFNANTL